MDNNFFTNYLVVALQRALDIMEWLGHHEPTKAAELTERWLCALKSSTTGGISSPGSTSAMDPTARYLSNSRLFHAPRRGPRRSGA